MPRLPAPARAPEEPKRLLGRYRLIERLGVGASASVWRARDRLRRRDVALKLLHPHLVSDRTARQRLALEARAARRLRHPAICRLLAAHPDGDQPALAFEWIAGETLATRLEREGALPASEAASIAADIAAALAHAHARGVVHRDVKPSNILLSAQGGVRLLDFGVSSAAGAALLTEAGSTVGTLAYMAPEQLAGEPPVAGSDVYGLGAVLYEMLAGRRPYEAQSALAMATAQQAPPAPLAADAGEAGRAALAALRPDPATRPQAAALAAMLERAASTREPPTEQIAATSATAVIELPRRSRYASPSRRSLAVGLAAAGLALAVTAVLANLGPALPNATPDAPPAAVGAPPLTFPTPAVATPTPTSAARDQPPSRPAADTNDDRDDDDRGGNDGKKKGKKEGKKKRGRGR